MKAFFAVLLAAGAAGAWEGHLAADGSYQRWSFASNGVPVLVELVNPPSNLPPAVAAGLRQAITQAAEAWQAVDTAHVPFRYLGEVVDHTPQPTELLISLDTGAFLGGHDATGLTELSLSGHYIQAAHVHLNFSADFQWAVDGSPSAIDLQSVLTHEMGHALGLAHTCGDPDTNTPSCAGVPEVKALAVMYPTIAPGPRRNLTVDDIAGITALLPTSGGAPEPAPSLSAVSPSCLDVRSPGSVMSEDIHLMLLATQGDLVDLELLQGDSVVSAAALAASGNGGVLAKIPGSLLVQPGQFDARLVAGSGKASVLFDAFSVKESCSGHGCSSAGGSALALLGLLALHRKRAKANCEGAKAPKGKNQTRLFRASAPSRFAVALLLLAAAPAFAYKRSVNTGGLCTWWATRGHPFQIDAQGTPDVPGLAAFTAVRKSVLTWSQVTCSDLSFPDQGLSQNPKDRVVGYFPGQYNRNLVLWRTKRCGAVVPPGDPCLTQGGCGNAYDCWDELVHGDGVIATTTTSSNRFTGQINDSDIELNDSVATDGTKITFTAVDGPPCTSQNQTGCVNVDVQNTVTHESGHTIGLDHSTDPSATMYATAPQGEVSKRVLGADDIQAVCDIYPKGARTVTCADDPISLTESSASNGGCGCTHAQTGPGAALGMLLLLLQISRRSRRKPQLAMSASSAPPSSSLRGSDIAS